MKTKIKELSKRTTIKKPLTKKAITKKAITTKSSAKKSLAKKVSTKKVTAKKVTAKKATVIKTSAKKTGTKNEVLAIRTKNNLTQTVFAKKLNISQSHLCKIERGEQKINIDTARILHKVFKIPSNKLLQSNI